VGLWDTWRLALKSLGYASSVVYLNSMFVGALGDPALQDRNRAYVLAVQESIHSGRRQVD